MSSDDFIVTPWHVEGDIDYEKLIKRFGTEKISAQLFDRMKKVAGEDHCMLRRGSFFSHRDMNVSLNEYEKAETNDKCDPGELEFTLVRGNFVKRFDNGDLIFGTWQSGTSCFDPATNFDTTFQIGTFTGGTGQFENASGPIRIDFTATFLAVPSQDGFDFGGASGTGEGTIIFNN